MKKIYFLFLFCLTSLLSFSQVFITEIADPNNNLAARYIELHNAGTTDVDFTEGNGWQIDKYLNGNSGVNTTLDLTGVIPAGGFYIIAYDYEVPGTFVNVYGFAPDQLDAVQNGVAGSNGDDDLALIDGTDTLVDFWGVYDFTTDINTDNTGTCAEYEDGRAERLTSVTSGSTTFNEAEWNIWADSAITGCTSHLNSPRTAPTDFDPGAWGTVTCSLALTTITTTCDAFTLGTDTYTATIDFTGGGTATYTVSSDSGTVDLSSGNPTNDVSGTITITGIAEGTDVLLSIVDGAICDINTTITSPTCDPTLTLPIYEGFDYTVGADLGDQPNWYNYSGTTNPIDIVSGNLSYLDLAASSGNSVYLEGGAIDSEVEFTAITSGKVYVSFILNITDLSNVTDLNDGGYIAILGAFDARVWVRPDTNPVGTTYGMAITNGSMVSSFTTTNYNVGDNVFVVMSYNIDNGEVNGWINPESANFGGSEPTALITDTDSSPSALIDSFALRQDSTAETPALIIDEIRIATTWAEVTPQSLSVVDNNKNQFSIFPNPTNTGFVNISSTNSADINIKVYDVLGKQVISETITNNTLNVSNLKSGVYIVKITQNNASTTKKLVIN
ncbi:T9SS type A sorting domain-containing protein [Winogradskyella endarachnes]|uniref:T9SS type A sorting domain-containing protein n=1 Tax=Winogradskyella endarachnes TaxID=2681965 RepID=A0A6L6U9B0_9FLAO|nr:T9SS type A sorting domain-containing protein [Winogradskyella endarachnes]MUU78609.1 T9SS type A sorting domain-containing protein [Winogradskyella endarachnes]